MIQIVANAINLNVMSKGYYGRHKSHSERKESFVSCIHH